MAHTLRELASLVGGRACGDEELTIHGAAILRDARPGDITLVDRPQLAPALSASQHTLSRSRAKGYSASACTFAVRVVSPPSC